MRRFIFRPAAIPFSTIIISAAILFVAQLRAQTAPQTPPDQPAAPPNQSQPAAPSGQQTTAPGAALQYHLEQAKPIDRFDDQQLDILEKLNRADRADLADLSEIIVPDKWGLPSLAYSPMPQSVPQLASHAKTIIIDLPAQAFGAYENGQLVRWGPVNTGKEDSPTPPGLYHLNWKSKLATSTFNPDWKMPYYFNFANYLGLGMHEYHLPGSPVSHGCVRMLARDAQWVFQWGRGWDVVDGKKVENGTPVLVVGQYKYGDPKPWLQTDWLSHGVELPADLMGEGTQ